NRSRECVPRKPRTFPRAKLGELHGRVLFAPALCPARLLGIGGHALKVGAGGAQRRAALRLVTDQLALNADAAAVATRAGCNRPPPQYGAGVHSEPNSTPSPIGPRGASRGQRSGQRPADTLPRGACCTPGNARPGRRPGPQTVASRNDRAVVPAVALAQVPRPGTYAHVGGLATFFAQAFVVLSGDLHKAQLRPGCASFGRAGEARGRGRACIRLSAQGGRWVCPLRGRSHGRSAPARSAGSAVRGWACSTGCGPCAGRAGLLPSPGGAPSPCGHCHRHRRTRPTPVLPPRSLPLSVSPVTPSALAREYTREARQNTSRCDTR